MQVFLAKGFIHAVPRAHHRNMTIRQLREVLYLLSIWFFSERNPLMPASEGNSVLKIHYKTNGMMPYNLIPRVNKISCDAWYTVCQRSERQRACLWRCRFTPDNSEKVNRRPVYIIQVKAISHVHERRRRKRREGRREKWRRQRSGRKRPDAVKKGQGLLRRIPSDPFPPPLPPPDHLSFTQNPVPNQSP